MSACPNTDFDGLVLGDLQGDGCVEYIVPALPLLEGVYNLTVAVVDATNTETYDYRDRLSQFRVPRYALLTAMDRRIWEVIGKPRKSTRQAERLFSRSEDKIIGQRVDDQPRHPRPARWPGEGIRTYSLSQVLARHRRTLVASPRHDAADLPPNGRVSPF